MHNLSIINHNGQAVADSREVAEVTGVRHFDLIDKIRGYEVHLLNGKFRSVDFFIESTYIDSTGRELPSYLLTRKGCDMVANKMTGEKGVIFTATYVTKFEEMEKKLVQPMQIDSKLLFQIAAQLEEKEKQIQLMSPKADFYDAVAGSKDAIQMSDVAKVLAIKGYGRNKLFEFLRNKGILDHNNIPYQKYIDCGYFRVIEQKFTKSDSSTAINIKTLVYQKGLDFIRRKINEN